MKEIMLSLCCLVALQLGAVGGQSMTPDSSTGYRLEPDPTYMIIVPKRIYPNQVIQVHVSILKLYFSHINVRASIRTKGEELAYFIDTFREPSTRLLQMRMPEYATSGNYTIRIEGTQNGGMSGKIFENETDIFFDSKQVSMFITTNKYIYCQGQTVNFRIIPVKPNLLPSYGSLDVYAEDVTGTTVRRWLAMQTNAGILDMSMKLSDQPNYGKWKIRAVAFGVDYTKEFLVEEFYQPRFYVNVSMPMYIMEDSYALAGVLTANHTSGRPVRGDGNITLEIRDPLKLREPNKVYQWPNITKDVSFFEGRTSFIFTMKELQNLIGKVPKNKELYVHAYIHDWYLQLNSTGFAICVVHSREVRVKLLGDRSRTFKPGFPVSVYYAVVHSDGTPLYGNRRQVTVEINERSVNGFTRSEEQKQMVRDDGVFQYDFVPKEDSKFIRIRAYYDTEGVSQMAECYLYRTYTHYDNYLAISTSTEQPRVNEYMVFTVRSNNHADQLYYLIVAAGNIIVANRLEMGGRQRTFSVALSRDMVPSARIVCWYILNGEVVADGLNFFVNGSDQNPIDVRVNMGKDFSRDTVEITGITDPGSYIAFSGSDYDVYTYGGRINIDENDIIEELETYDHLANKSFGHTFYLGEETYQKVYFPAPTYGVDANTTFDFAGLIVFTDANLTRIPHDCNETRGYLPCNDGMCYLIEQRCDNVMQCEDGVDEMGCPKNETDIFTPPIERFRHLPRHYNEEGDWAWKSHFVKPDGRIDLRSKVPKEPMSWLVGAISMSRDKGLGVTQRPARYQSTRFFYIQAEMPEVVVKGEQIGVRIALFNYWDVDLECLVTLHDSDQYRFILVEDFGIVSSYKPRTTRGNIQTMVFVQKSRMMTIYMPVLPIVDDELSITISATSFMGNDQVTKTVKVIWDGVTNHYNTPYLVDLINHGSMIIPDFEIIIPERFVDPGRREHLFVPGSGKAVMSIIGDAVGPGFFEPFLNAENMMRKPYGSAEQSMFNFAANLYYLKFMKETNQLKDTVLDTALEYMNLAMQRQLSYLNATDGSFSMFRDYREPKPSTWLTAYILGTFSNADEADWRATFYVPADLLNKIAIWVCRQQNQSTGAFQDEAPMYDFKMMSNYTVENGIEINTNLSLTAHVLIALSQATGVSGAARTQVDSARLLAMKYVEKFVPFLTDPYQTALVTYALTLAKSNRMNDAFYKMETMRRSTAYTYWAMKDIPPNPSRIVNTVPFNRPRLIYPQEAYAVEATSYALLVYLRMNRLRDAEPIMGWLQTMRNSIGGFGSTRDSAIALQALTEYGKRDTNRDLYNMRIELEATSTPFWRKTVDLDKSNWAQAQLIEIPGTWGEVKAKVQGTGMALMQLHVQVNVEYPHQQAPKANGTFYNVEIDRLYFHGKNFSVMEMTACAKWVRPDLTLQTGMTVMEINIPTGYVSMNDDLRYYVQSGSVPNLGRAEYYDRKVVFYLDYVKANERTCVHFRADRWFPIANATIQHEIKVYDYYEPGLFNRTLYTTYNLFNLHICQVCGSFQCPYCPYYNTANVVGVSTFTSVLVALSVLLITGIINRDHR